MPSAVVAYSLLTPFGDAGQTFDALLAGRALCDVGRVADLQSTGRVHELARRAAEEALSLTDSKDGTALVVGTSKGAIDDWLAKSARLAYKPWCPHSGSLWNESLESGWGLAAMAGELHREFRLRGPVLTVSSACASGLIALIRAVMMIERGDAKRVLVLAAESSLHPLLLASYRRLGVLAPDAAGCRPFDQRRNGFFVSEAAAAVVLEAYDPANSQIGGVNTSEKGGQNADFTPLLVRGMAMASDAISITANNPDPGILGQAIARVLTSGPPGLPLAPDLIHAHATGTEHHDPLELAAIESALPDAARVPVYSHKGALGHTLGASGLISFVLNCICHRQGVIPGNIRTESPLTSQRTQIHQSPLQRPVKTSVVIAAGFGGPIAAVGLQNLAHRQ